MTARTGQVRIIGGKWKRRKLRFPVIVGLRPTPSRLRETVFAWLGDSIEGAKCLDLCAGSGAFGVESLSRGASHGDFVEKDRRASAALRASLQELAAENAQVWSMDARKFLKLAAEREETWDLVFLDPPFASPLLAALFPQSLNLLRSETSRICVEYPKRSGLVQGPWRELRASSVGDTRVSLIAPQGQAPI